MRSWLGAELSLAGPGHQQAHAKSSQIISSLEPAATLPPQGLFGGFAVWKLGDSRMWTCGSRGGMRTVCLQVLDVSYHASKNDLPMLVQAEKENISLGGPKFYSPGTCPADFKFLHYGVHILGKNP